MKRRARGNFTPIPVVFAFNRAYTPPTKKFMVDDDESG